MAPFLENSLSVSQRLRGAGLGWGDGWALGRRKCEMWRSPDLPICAMPVVLLYCLRPKQDLCGSSLDAQLRGSVLGNPALKREFKVMVCAGILHQGMVSGKAAGVAQCSEGERLQAKWIQHLLSNEVTLTRCERPFCQPVGLPDTQHLAARSVGCAGSASL